MDTPSPSAQHREGGEECRVRLLPAGREVGVPQGALLADALERAGLAVPLPCGGQGRCGRCVVVVQSGAVRRRSTLRLTEEEVSRGHALACQTLVLGDLIVYVPPAEEALAHKPSDEKAGAERAAPVVAGCAHTATPWVERMTLSVEPPSLTDNASDLERVQRALAAAGAPEGVEPTLSALRQLPGMLRQGEWRVSARVARPDPPAAPRLIDLRSPVDATPLYGLAVDIGTTSVVVYLVDLETRALRDHASAYNAQIARGEDVISRIIYARQPERLEELRRLVTDTLNGLIDETLARQSLSPDDIARVTVAANTTMTHLFLGIEPQYIRLEPYVPAASEWLPVRASDLALHTHPEALVDCLPAVGAYVGGDITAGVLRSGMAERDELAVLIDIGTNGEIVLGNADWLVTCACSAGPAFEGAGATSGTRAVTGAIEEVWIDPASAEPTVQTIGGAAPVGICGSGMIALLGEMRTAGLMDKAGRIRGDHPSPRLRRGTGGAEYVLVWAGESATRRDIALSNADVQNLLRAKAAIYAGLTVAVESVGLSVQDVERFYIGGAFGQHLDIEKAVHIGLLPDLPWERYTFLGNTAVQGAMLALTCRTHRRQASELARRMTYLELSADNRFMEAFTSALFIPHTDATLFPSVAQTLEGEPI